MKSPLKRYSHTIHKILGLLSGIVVFIVSLTGACWVFQEEITHWIEGDIEIHPTEGDFITADKAKAIALEVYPNNAIHGTAYGRTDEPVQVIFYEAEPEFYRTVYLHPQTGEVLKTKDHRAGFFGFILKGHLYLWLPEKIGSQIASYGVMIFVLLLITGLILWWPKNKKNAKKRFAFMWKPTTKWKRKNYDLHNIVGFYSFLLALVLAFSGLIMAFNWIYYVTYISWGGNKDPRFVIPNHAIPNDSTVTDSKTLVLNNLVPKLMAENPYYHEIELHYPHSDSASIYIEVSYQKSTYYSSDYRFFNQYNGQEIDSKSIYSTYDKASVADKVMRMNYDIHVGAIGGLVGKIIAFIISLICTSLPITGFLIWWGRNKKSARKSSKKLMFEPT